HFIDRRRGRRRGVNRAVLASERPFGWPQRLICLYGIVWREGLRFLQQRERFISALVRPMVWLFIFAAGFRQTLGVSIMPPYDTYVLYEVYITPGLIAMIQLFNGMQSSLSMVYDREMGSMRMLLVSPAPRWFLLTSKLIAGVAVSILQVYGFLVVAYFWEIEPPTWWGYLTVLPALALSGLMLGALGMLLSSVIKQLENFAGVMNFVIFPMFFASSALYPLWRVQEGSPWLASVCRLNPYTYSVELIRFAFYQQVDWLSLAVVAGCTIVFLGGAVLAVVASGCLASGAAAPDRLRIALQKTGTASWEIEVIKARGLDKAANLDIATTELASTEAGKIAIEGGSADLVVEDWLWAARERALGDSLLFTPYSTALGAV